jgi:predicted RNA-binding protein with PUA domain
MAVKIATAKKKVGKDDSYVCEACGLVVSVDEVCGCVDVCDIICCGQPMKRKEGKAKATKK